MFGLFKQEKNEDNLNHPEYLALVVKWETFLKKIEERFNDSLVNAKEALMDNLDHSDYDINPTLRAWSGIEAQLSQLIEKVEHTFENTVKPQMLSFVEDWHLVSERQKGTILNESIFKRLERFEIVVKGLVSIAFFDHAVKELNESFSCTQCSAELEVRKDIFRPHYISCDYCNTVNTFTPSDKVAQIRWVVENIAKYRSIEAWDEMTKSMESYQSLPCKADHEDNSELKAAFKIRAEKERLYWLAYMKERSQMLPEHKDNIEHDVSVKMRHVHDEGESVYNIKPT